jgi:ribosomal protein L16 Arg81 hydroxylase
MALLGHYGVSSDNSLTFTVDFAIPNNCNYNITTVSKINYINIQLNSGQTIPSTTFNSFTEDFITTDGYLNLQFKQTQNSTTVTKPKMLVTN